MAPVEKITVSLPAELLARIEQRRRDRRTSRSATVSELLWRGWRQVEAEEREARYRAAYEVQPESDEERAWADDTAADLLAEADPGWESDVPATPGRRTRRPAAKSSPIA